MVASCILRGSGTSHDADIGLDGAEGKIFCRNAGFGQGVEEGGFAHIRKTHDSAIE
jgi:hypothetical protein